MGAKSDVAVKLVLVFFISLLSFSIGTYIGKKYSDNQHKLAQLEPGADKEKRSIASEGHDAHEATPAKPEMISDDEIKSLADDKLKKEEFIADDTESDEHADPHAKPAVSKHADPHAAKETREPAKTHQADAHAIAAPVAGKKENASPVKAPVPAVHGDMKKDEHAPAHQPSAKNHEDAPLEAAKSFLDGKVPEAKTVTKVENRLPSSLPKDISQYALGKFTVQVASYNTKEEAEKRATKLKEQGYQTNVFPAKVADKMWYRVSFGLYGTNDEAQTERTKYLEKFKTESALVQKIKN